MYDYTPCNDDEMCLHEDDVVEVMERCDDGWFVGLNQRSGQFGTFPGNYVEKVWSVEHIHHIIVITNSTLSSSSSSSGSTVNVYYHSQRSG